MTAALVPGSFDPPTNGHLDVIERCVGIFDEVIVGVIKNPSKSPLFDESERIEMLTELCSQWETEFAAGRQWSHSHPRSMPAKKMWPSASQPWLCSGSSACWRSRFSLSLSVWIRLRSAPGVVW